MIATEQPVTAPDTPIRFSENLIELDARTKAKTS